MNVSMMDSYNLAWKLLYHINGLAPEPTGANSPASLLETYQTERHEIAQQLIDFDRKFSTMFSGQMGATEGLTQEEFQQAFKLGNGFTSGCGVEYPENMLVIRDEIDADIKSKGPNPVTGTDYISGILRPGRRLLNVRLLRHADGWQRDIHDGMSSQMEISGWISYLTKSPQIFPPLADSASYVSRRPIFLIETVSLCRHWKRSLC